MLDAGLKVKPIHSSQMSLYLLRASAISHRYIVIDTYACKHMDSFGRDA